MNSLHVICDEIRIKNISKYYVMNRTKVELMSSCNVIMFNNIQISNSFGFFYKEKLWISLFRALTMKGMWKNSLSFSCNLCNNLHINPMTCIHGTVGVASQDISGKNIFFLPKIVLVFIIIYFRKQNWIKKQASKKKPCM